MKKKINRPGGWLLTATFSFLCLLAILAGCAGLLLGGGPSKTLYTLQEWEGEDCSGSKEASSALRLVLAGTYAPPYIDSQSIIFSRETGTRAVYQLSGWVEPPPARFRSLLLRRLECERLFKEVSRAELSADAELMLSTRLEEFYHDATEEPGKAMVKVRAELFDLRRRHILAVITLSESAVTPSFDARGAVHGLSQAMGAIIDELVKWLSQVGPKE